MPKKVEDILKSNKRSIRDIPVNHQEVKRASQKSTSNSKIKINIEEDDKNDDDTIDTPPNKAKKVSILEKTFSKRGHSKNNKWRTVIFFFASLIILGTIGYFVSIKFASAKLDLYKKEYPVVVNGSYVAKPQTSFATSSISYKLITFSASASSKVKATEKMVSESKSKGSLVLYNSYSTKSQKLLAGTRLSEDLDHIYRTNQTVTIPGYSTKNGSIIPGKITVSVTADMPGDQYNVSFNEKSKEDIYKVVAYKGTDKYINIYGKLNSSLSGGKMGIEKVVDTVTLNTALALLKKDVLSQIDMKYKNALKENDLFYEQASLTSYDNPILSGTTTGEAVITVKGSKKGLIFDKKSFISKVAGEKSVEIFYPYSFESLGLSDLKLTLLNNSELSKETHKDITFRLAGNITLKANIPVDTIKKDFAGKPFSEVNSLLGKYKAILGAGSSAQLIPPWATVIPNNPDRITISVKN